MARRILNTIFNVVPQGTKTVVETLGRFSAEKETGSFLAIPLIQRLKSVDMRETMIPISPQECITHDNVRVLASGHLFVRPIDVKKICYASQDPYLAVSAHAKSAIRTAIGNNYLEILYRNRTIVDLQIEEEVQKAAKSFGFEVAQYKLIGIYPDGTVKEAVDSQALFKKEWQSRDGIPPEYSSNFKNQEYCATFVDEILMVADKRRSSRLSAHRSS